MNRMRAEDRVEQTARRHVRHHQCRELVCEKPASKGQLCDRHFEAAFSQGMVLH